MLSKTLHRIKRRGRSIKQQQLGHVSALHAWIDSDDEVQKQIYQPAELDMDGAAWSHLTLAAGSQSQSEG